MEFDPATFRLNSPLGKRILAAAREGDYAHSGEEEAIRMALADFAADPPAHWLDAGCGQDGTAADVQRAGWATGFYEDLLVTIRAGALGGAIFIAEAEKEIDR